MKIETMLPERTEPTSPVLSLQHRLWIETRAREAGFDLAGVAGVPDPASEAAAEADRRFAAFVAAGRAGDMNYLKRTDEAGNYLRGDLRRTIPWARSVIVCAVNYNTDAPLSTDPAGPRAGWIARYAWSGRKRTAGQDSAAGADYHDILLPQLRAVEVQLKRRFGGSCQTRCYVDTGPIVERGFAAQAGIGWIGKNTCVIHQQQGSWLLLGVIVTSLELAPESAALPSVDRCGTCTRCIDACPTDALLPGRQMDASRCIAYLTIEKSGSIPEGLRAPMGRQIFGCDICQDVCPWNSKAPVSAGSALPARQALINPALDWLAGLDGLAFNRLFRGSPLQRTRREVSRRKLILRNVAIAMGNSGQAEFLPQLETWAAGKDSVLADAAQWAIQRIEASR
jgi:epoxyqueuosine reductase